MSFYNIDPYFLNQKEVVTSVNQLQQMLSDREDMLHDSRGVNPDVFRTVGNNMQKEIQQTRNLLQDINDSIKVVRTNPSRYQITEAELNNRESFYNNTIQELNDIENKMNTQTSNQRVQFTFQPVPQDTSLPTNNYNPSSNYNSNGQAPQYQFQQHQEEQIDQLSVAIDQQMQLSKIIKDEIEEQNRLILDLDENIDNAHTAMKKVTNQITQLIENEGKTPTYLVAILSLVLIFMLFIVA